MLINQKPEQKHVKFVLYTGRWPNLCNGKLILNIDGKDVVFGNKYTHKYVDFPRFWESSGSAHFNIYTGGSDICTGEWIIDASLLPEQYQQYAREIDEVFNGNVERGCCGGCL